MVNVSVVNGSLYTLVQKPFSSENWELVSDGLDCGEATKLVEAHMLSFSNWNYKLIGNPSNRPAFRYKSWLYDNDYGIWNEITRA